MVNLTIGNSYSSIKGLTTIQEKELRNELSYVIGGKNSFFSKYGPRHRSLLTKKGEFPTGLLKRVLLMPSIINFDTKDLRKKPQRKLNVEWLKGVPVPYEDQIAALSAAIDNHRGVISMPTGTGKSFVIALIAAELRVKTLVVVPSLEIKKQLKISFNYLFKDPSFITVENIDSKNLENVSGYDCLIIDEAHHGAAKTYQKLNKTAWAGIYHRFFMTATPFRNDPEEDLLLESIVGQLIYELPYERAVSKGYIVPIEAYYLEIPKQDTDAYTYAQVYSELVVNNKIRNELIANLLNRLTQNTVYTLCLVREVAHGKILSEITCIPFVSGEDDDSRDYIRQFNSGELKSIIGTEGVLSEGVDTKPCEYVVIAGLGKAKSSLMQKCGRGVRRYQNKESAKIIIFRDSSHKYLLRHYKEQCKILKEEYDVIPIKLDVE